jgi:hypothetical protein
LIKKAVNIRLLQMTLALFAVASVLCSCAGVHYRLPQDESGVHGQKNEHWQRTRDLKRALLDLDPGIIPEEAALVAETAVFYSLELANEYELITPPLFHNTLVNLGMKERGLCIHWAEDLLARLRSLNVECLEFHWGVANRHATFRIEHSTVVVTARGRPFEQGMVLDPWRDSGRLFFGAVKEDKYVWEKWQP